MMPIDTFIHQLIQLGLADSFLDVINTHYLKVVEVYNIISFIDENNIRDIYLNNDEYKDGFRVTINLYNPVEIDNSIEYSKEFSVQIINNGNSIEITVINNYESEEEIYEARFSEHGDLNKGKWS
jgi:sRNA-binding regulator protein Hfq